MIVEWIGGQGDLDVYRWGPLVIAIRVDVRPKVHGVWLLDPEALGFGEWPWIEATDWDRTVARRQAEYRERKSAANPTVSSTR